MPDLLKRREEVLEANRKASKERGSGWHPADFGAEQRERQGEMDLTDRPVALQDDDQIHVVGACVATVRAALARAVAKAEADPRAFYTDAYTTRFLKSARRALAQGDAITLPTQDWNYCMHGLTEAGVQVVLASV